VERLHHRSPSNGDIRCWHAQAAKRPSIEEVIEALNGQLGATADASSVPGNAV
jgi:hypothetical protein